VVAIQDMVSDVSDRKRAPINLAQRENDFEMYNMRGLLGRGVELGARATNHVSRFRNAPGQKTMYGSATSDQKSKGSERELHSGASGVSEAKR